MTQQLFLGQPKVPSIQQSREVTHRRSNNLKEEGDEEKMSGRSLDRRRSAAHLAVSAFGGRQKNF